jgi:pimeloyl-ACP methyl ester carboxylesterase
MRRLVGDQRWESLPQGTRQQRRAEGRALLADLAAMKSGGAPFDAAMLDVPVVAGYGSVTSDRHQRATRELAGEVTDCELVTIEDAPHGAHYSHPEQFASFIRQTVARAA